MSKLDLDYQKVKHRQVLTNLMNGITSNDYQLGYFQDIYDLPYTQPDMAYQLEAKEWIALLEHAWKFVYRAAIEDNHLCEQEKMDLNNIHKLRNFYAAQLKSGRKLMLHHNFITLTHRAKEIDYENVYDKKNKVDQEEQVILLKKFERKYEPEPEKSVNNRNSPYYVPKPYEINKPSPYSK